MFRKFRQLCGQAGLLPASHIILERSTKTTDQPIASGKLGDVSEGIYNGRRVAIKALRVYKDYDVRKVRKVIPLEFSI